MLDFIKLDANCVLEYTNWPVCTTGNEPSFGNYLYTDPEETIEDALTRKTTLPEYTVTRWTQANWMSFDLKWTRYRIWQNSTILKPVRS